MLLIYYLIKSRTLKVNLFLLLLFDFIANTSQTLSTANMEYFGVQRVWGPVGFAVRYVCY